MCEPYLNTFVETPDYVCCRRKAVPVSVAGLREEIRSLGRVGQAPADTHRREELHLSRLQQEVHAQRPPQVQLRSFSL